MTSKTGTLYLVGTPIGNLDDMTFRALKVIEAADSLYCEDTRRTSMLLKHFKLSREVLSFHDHSSRNALMKIREKLAAGESVAYITDAGLPAVSDPGFVLVREAHAVNANVTVIPGPSAATMLFAMSGLPSPKFLFHGFFPRTRGEIEKAVEQVKSLAVVHLFYEAPGRVTSLLEVLSRNFPEAQIAVGRELTKVHEELVRGKASKVFEALGAREKIKGECVVAVLGGEENTAGLSKKRRAESATGADLQTEGGEATVEVIELTVEQKEEITRLVKSGVSSKDAAKELSKKFKMPRRVIYEFIIRHLT